MITRESFNDHREAVAADEASPWTCKECHRRVWQRVDGSFTDCDCKTIDPDYEGPHYAVIVERRYYGEPATIKHACLMSQHGAVELFQKRAEAHAAAARLNSEVRLSHNQYAELWSIAREGSRRYERATRGL